MKVGMIGKWTLYAYGEPAYLAERHVGSTRNTEHYRAVSAGNMLQLLARMQAVDEEIKEQRHRSLLKNTTFDLVFR